MPDETIRAALEAAACALWQSLRAPDTCAYQSVCVFSPCVCAHDAAAAAVAAFLRALPPYIVLPTGNGDLRAGMSGFAMLAAAVEEAAREP